MQLPHIDGGAPFDWGRASAHYARWRDIYPPAFYDMMLRAGLCTRGQQVLDVGTGTGVLPRNLHRHGAHFTAVDPAPQQIAQARRLSAEAGLDDIIYQVAAAEALDFADDSFDVVTACQCIEYFDIARFAPRLRTVLRGGGRFAILYMAWLPHKSAIARQSEELVLRHNPAWAGAGWTIERAPRADWAGDHGFKLVHREQREMDVAFTRESWAGRMLACRGVAAALDDEETARFAARHNALLANIAPHSFTIPHGAVMLVLENCKGTTHNQGGV